MFIIILIVLVCVGLICYQDMKYRAVYWVCFPILSVLLFFLKQDHMEISVVLTDVAIASLFFGTQLFLVWAYLSIKNKQLVNITANYLGLGDILFLMAITFYLSPVNYIFFYVGSLVVVLIYTLITRFFKKNTNQEIPLAGLQALMLGCLLALSMLYPGLKLYSDSWIYGL